jgi:hypothetical protein
VQQITAKKLQVHSEPVVLTKTAAPSAPVHAVKFAFEQFTMRGMSLCTVPYPRGEPHCTAIENETTEGEKVLFRPNWTK